MTIDQSAGNGHPEPVLHIERRDAIALVQMNRPDHYNASDADLHRQLAHIWTDLGSDDSVRAVVLTGAGKAFSAGGDFALMLATREDPSVADRVFAEARQTVLGMLNLPQPIVAAVNGPAVGLGASLAALCDISIAADTSYFADPHLSVGLVPGDGAAMLWPLLVGLARAKELVLLGQRVSAAKALEIGLINRVVPQEKTLEAALEVAGALASMPARALQDAKRLMNAQVIRALAGVLDQAIAAERLSVGSAEHGEIVEHMIKRNADRANRTPG